MADNVNVRTPSNVVNFGTRSAAEFHPFVYDTKLVPPPLKDYLPRPRLLDRLLESIDHKLTLICASAGAGKTTLLSEFSTRMNGDAVWLRLDSSDKDPSIFTKSLLLALSSRAGPAKPQDGLPADAWNIQAALPRLVTASSRAAQVSHGRLLLVLDDYHKVGTSDAINRLLDGFVELSPPAVHLVLSSRSLPALPLAKLRLSGQLLEMTQDDLAMDAEEISSFLIGWRGLRLNEDDVQLVLARTGGWIAGVSMLGELLKGRDVREIIAFLRKFSGSSRVVFDYFAEEVLRQQSPSVQHFLISTSVLGELHRDLVNPLLGIANAQSVLETLAADNMFLVCLDETRDWYRYHPLFHEFLRAKAERSLTRRVLRRLHQRSAEAYASLENWGRAVHHLCTAESFAEAALMIERVGHQHIERGNLETVTHWLSSLPDAVKQERPWLLVMEGRVAERQGSYRRAAEVLTRAQSLFAEQGNGDGLLRVAIDRALVSHRLGNHREAVDLVECALGSASDGQTRADMLGTLCLNYKDMGELERSSRFGEAALKALASAQGSSFRPGLESRTLRVLAQTYLDQGHPDRALSLVLKAKDLCLRESLGDLELGWVLCTLGVVRAVRGEMDLALQAFREAEEKTASYVQLQRHRVNRWRCSISTDLGDFAQAEEYEQQAGLPTAELSWLYLRQQQVGRAISIAREGLERPASGETPLQRACLLGVLGMALAADGQIGPATELLREAADALAAHGYVHYLASLRLRLAQLQIESGQTVTGVRLLRQALETADSRGLYHFYWWDPDLMARVLGLALDYYQLRPYVQHLVERHQAATDRRAFKALAGKCAAIGRGSAGSLDKRATALAQRAAAVLASCPDAVTRTRIEQAVAGDQVAYGCVVRLHDDFGLTWREIEVFLAYYMERRFSETEADRGRVAEGLCMTENTLKSHVRSIRRKLGLSPYASSLQVYHLVVPEDPSRGQLRRRDSG